MLRKVPSLHIRSASIIKANAGGDGVRINPTWRSYYKTHILREVHEVHEVLYVLSAADIVSCTCIHRGRVDVTRVRRVRPMTQQPNSLSRGCARAR